MYQVMKLYGDSEPWWFLDGWEEDIVSIHEFQDYETALAYFEQEKAGLALLFPQQKSHMTTMISFWSPEERIWCEECVEDLQYYHSLLLMEKDTAPQAKQGEPGHSRSCSLKSQRNPARS